MNRETTQMKSETNENHVFLVIVLFLVTGCLPRDLVRFCCTSAAEILW